MGGAIRNKQTANALAPMVASGDYESAMAYAGSRGDLGQVQDMQEGYKSQLSEEQAARRTGILRYGMSLLQTPVEQRNSAEVARNLAQFGVEADASQFTDLSDARIHSVMASVQDEKSLLAQYAEMQKKPEPYTLGQGGTRFDGNNQQVANNPAAEKPPAPGMVKIDGEWEYDPNYISGQEKLAGLRGGGSSGNVQGQFVTEDGFLGYLTRGGERVVTDIKVRNNYGIIDMGGGVRGAFDPRAGTATPLMSPEQVGYNAATVETSKANEAARVEAEQGLPEAMSKWNIGVSTLEALRDSRGFDSRYGIASVIPAIPGTDMADTQALINQMGGQAFLDAFESLKGGGQITQIEGEKATQAMTILTSQGIRVETAAKAIDDLIAIKRDAAARAIAKASGTYGTQGPDAPPLVFNAATGDFD
jgi:hypothetical protein